MLILSGAAVLLSTLFMGLLGVLVIAPIACIELGWNFFATHFYAMPVINPWQAILLYLAGSLYRLPIWLDPN